MFNNLTISFIYPQDIFLNARRTFQVIHHIICKLKKTHSYQPGSFEKLH